MDQITWSHLRNEEDLPPDGHVVLVCVEKQGDDRLHYSTGVWANSRWYIFDSDGGGNVVGWMDADRAAN
jgi:hypothetical protein